jgi:uncharacterized protein YjlB
MVAHQTANVLSAGCIASGVGIMDVTIVLTHQAAIGITICGYSSRGFAQGDATIVPAGNSTRPQTSTDSGIRTTLANGTASFILTQNSTQSIGINPIAGSGNGAVKLQ